MIEFIFRNKLSISSEIFISERWSTTGKIISELLLNVIFFRKNDFS